MQRSDLVHLAAIVRQAGELLEQRGEHAWTITRQWQAGPSAANLDPGRGAGTISDPTGRAALTVDLDPHAELVHCIAAARAAAINLTDILNRVGAPRTGRWCHWMLQVGVREPAPRTIDGQPACEWVYRKWLNGQLPTSDQLERRAAGRRNRGAA